MNNHARAIIDRFKSIQNIQLLQRSLLGIFNGHPKVIIYLRESMIDLINTFVATMRREMSLADVMQGVPLSDHVAAYNVQFIRDRISFIQDHVLGSESAEMFTVGDGLPTSRFGAAHYSKPTDDILATWNMNANHPPQSREDSQGSRYYPQNCQTTPDDANYNPYHGQGDNHMTTGVVFCDQSHLGTAQHMSQLLDGSAIVNLNREGGYTNVAFGNATPASDARLLSRRIFRSNEQGIENGIRMPEVRLQRRHLERDVDETLRNSGERDGLNRGYDMGSLYRRVEHKQTARASYQPRCEARRPNMSLYNVHTPVETPRYC